MAVRRAELVFKRVHQSGMHFTLLQPYAVMIAASRILTARVDVQAVIPVGDMAVETLQQWARTFQAYSHVRSIR